MNKIELESYVYNSKFAILGAILEVRCKHEVCLDGIEEFFSTLITYEVITPDIIIYCSWEKSDRYLYRTRPTRENEVHLPGVFYETPDSVGVLPWDSYDPPLPPFIKKPFINNFVALHAGAIKGNKNDAIIFIGPRASGKTTSTLELVNNFDFYELITDETLYIRKRTNLVEPFPRLILPRTIVEGDIRKYALSAKKAYKKIAKSSALISHGFFLNGDIEGKASIQKVSDEEAFRNIIEHYQYAGTDLLESILTLRKLTERTTFSSINYHKYDDLKEILKDVPSYLEKF